MAVIVKATASWRLRRLTHSPRTIHGVTTTIAKPPLLAHEAPLGERA